MVNLGIDFGSTYTMVSVFKNGEPVTIQPNSQNYNYPSIVVKETKRRKNGQEETKFHYAWQAVSKIGKPGTVTFRGFKMLLNRMMDEQYLKERGYDESFTPEKVTEMFLKYVIETTLSNLNEEVIDTLVMGAPECWFKSPELYHGREVLRSICDRLKTDEETGNTRINRVRLVSEPTNAAAFCLWKYEKNNDQPFRGDILVIDYGGGTLDTTIVSVKHVGDTLQLRSEVRSGAGENRDNELGKAGIAYQEAVLQKAITEYYDGDESKVKFGSEMDVAMRQLENELINYVQDVDDTFYEYTLDPDALEEEDFTTVEYCGDDITIYYSHMKQAYDEVISPIVKKVLDETTENLGLSDEVYLALVGGFCNFYLVRKQITDYFAQGTLNSERHSLVHTQDERDKAIAHGAALFADSVVEERCVARFGIGMYAVQQTTSEVFMRYAINIGQEYVPDDIYFARDENGKLAPMVLVRLDKFLLNFDPNEKGQLMRPTPEFAKLLNSVEHSPIVLVGFSIDQEERITVHVFKDPLGKTEEQILDEKPIASIQLSTMAECFENTFLS